MNHDASSSDDIPGSVHWIKEEEREYLKEELGGAYAVPMYLLPERSTIEHHLNTIRLNYNVSEEQELKLDELVFDYNRKIDIALKSVKRWQTERGNTAWDINALLYMEQPEIWSAIECLQDLSESCKKLFTFVAKLQPKKTPIVPDYISHILESYREP
jgi:hypothetical protein